MTAFGVLLLAAAVAAGGERPIRELRWQEAQEGGKVLSGRVRPVGPEGEPWLRVTAGEGAPKTHRIAVLEGVEPQSGSLAVEGMVQCRDVEPDGYLEMWTVYPDGRRHFTRTLADRGPMRKLSGSSAPRPFALPFTFGDDRPQRVTLEINAVLPGSGTVDVGPLRVVQPWDGSVEVAGAWWSPRTGGWVGGLLGAFVGVTLGAVGALAGMGKAPRASRVLAVVVMAVGFFCLAAGAVAAMRSQPFGVYYPLLLPGLLAAAIGGITLALLRWRRRSAELRKMQAIDT
jgi:hypothetical protein